MAYRGMCTSLRLALVASAAMILLVGCSDDDSSPPAAPTATRTVAGATATSTRAPEISTATATKPVATSSPTSAPTIPATATATTGAATATSTQTAAGDTPTPTATPTGSGSSYVGDYNGVAGGYGTRFHVDANGTATGFLDFLSGALATDSGAADIVQSYDASGTANLETGAYQLSGEFFGNSFSIAGELPATADAPGSLTITVFNVPSTGELHKGSITPTPPPSCDTADLEVTLSNASVDFNGDTSAFTVDQMNVAVEQKAPDYIPVIHEVYNSTFIGTNCAATRNIQILLFQSPGGLAAGQTFPIGDNSGGPGALVYYGQMAGADSVWSSSPGGSVVIDSVEGSVVTMHVVDANLDMPAGNAAGSVVMNVTGSVNNFTRQVD